MNFRVDRWSAAALIMVGALLLSSCGGSGVSGQSRRFHPTRMIVFGDEASLLLTPSTATATDALKYTNNGFNPFTTPLNTQIDCRANLLWVQALAIEFNLRFRECNPDGLPATGQMLATAGAKVADVVSAIDTFLASNSVGRTDLVTLMVGTNDIVELYTSVTTSAVTEAAALAEAERRAELVAAQVSRLTDNQNNTRARVIYATVPDVSDTPFAIAEPTGRAERVRLLKALSERFNDRLRGQVPVNGRSIGSLNAFQLLRNIVQLVENGDTPTGIANVKDAACTNVGSVLGCNTTTLRAGATDTNYLWASGVYFSAGTHVYLGNQAVDLATNLPF